MAEVSEGMKRKYSVLQRMMHEALGDPAPGEVTREQLLDFRSLLERMPPNHGKGKTGKLPIREAVAATDEQEKNLLDDIENRYATGKIDRKTRDLERDQARVQRLSPSMINRHVERISELSKFLRREGHHPPGLPIEGVRLSKREFERRQRERPPTDRRPWGVDGLQKLFTSPIFTDPGERSDDEPLFWAPLIAATMGLRSEEALQLKAHDLETLEGIPCLRIRAGTGQRLKTPDSERDIPVPDFLLKAGLGELFERQKMRGCTWLFPNLDRGAAEGSFTDVFTKRFRYYRRKHGLDDPHRDFHSLRYDFNALLARAEIPKTARQRLMGHKIADVTDGVYDPEGETFAQRRTFVNRLKAGLDIDFKNGRPVVILRDRRLDDVPTVAAE